MRSGTGRWLLQLPGHAAKAIVRPAVSRCANGRAADCVAGATIGVGRVHR